ncbi:hypothetical protein MtrunA17_Chr6g0453091 [Medicago truncatula]|uniref:Uncharacterized protein n=1 Tax=Medicago truncatula TaxID=3880 RepID=A0A396HBJ6_MEDTR|nr:hypothetical protein MtrunA17_Chr6g0453091 [Medicago truncatula]
MLNPSDSQLCKSMIVFPSLFVYSNFISIQFLESSVSNLRIPKPKLGTRDISGF